MEIIKKLWKKEDPLFNVFLEIEGIKYIQKLFGHNNTSAKIINDSNKYRGYFQVLTSGKLVSGIKKGLHLFEGSVDLQEEHKFPFVHSHLKHNGNIEDIDLINDNAYFRSRVGMKPIYTLNGLYSSFCPQNELEKILCYQKN